MPGTTLNTGNWIWESKENEDLWNMLGRSWLRFPDMLSWGDQVFANPENPKPE